MTQRLIVAFLFLVFAGGESFGRAVPASAERLLRLVRKGCFLRGDR